MGVLGAGEYIDDANHVLGWFYDLGTKADGREMGVGEGMCIDTRGVHDWPFVDLQQKIQRCGDTILPYDTAQWEQHCP